MPFYSFKKAQNPLLWPGPAFWQGTSTGVAGIGMAVRSGVAPRNSRVAKILEPGLRLPVWSGPVINVYSSGTRRGHAPEELSPQAQITTTHPANNFSQAPRAELLKPRRHPTRRLQGCTCRGATVTELAISFFGKLSLGLFVSMSNIFQ